MNNKSNLFDDELKEYFQGFYADSTTHPGIFAGRTVCADSVCPGWALSRHVVNLNYVRWQLDSEEI